MTLEKDPTTNIEYLDLGSVTGTPPLQVLVGRTEACTRVIVAGELDDATAAVLSDRLREVLIDLSGDVVIDIGLLTFIDSSGLSLLVTFHKHVRSLGATLIVTDPTPMARRLFEITGLDRVLTIEPPEWPRT